MRSGAGHDDFVRTSRDRDGVPHSTERRGGPPAMRDRREFPDDGSDAPQWRPYPTSHDKVGDPKGTS